MKRIKLGMRMRSEGESGVMDRQSSGVRVNGISARGHLPLLQSFKPYRNRRNQTHSRTRPEDISCRTFENEGKVDFACCLLYV